MDVDLLRTGTVPINPDTVLWFEFLLDPSMLEKHLHKWKPDPSPTELIIKFMSIAPDPPAERCVNPDGEITTEPKRDDIMRSKKSLALKIMSLKIAAYLNWNLDILELKLPLPMQVTLLQDLLLLTQGKEISVTCHENLDIETVPPHELFAILLYHRWVLRAAVGARLIIKQPRPPFIPIPGLQDPLYVPPQLLEEMLLGLEAQVPESLILLNRIAEAPDHLALSVPVYETFLPLTEDSAEMTHDWDVGPKASAAEVRCQVHFDLGAFHFSREQYDRSKEHMSEAARLFAQLPDKPTFCVVENRKLDGYCAALGINWGQQSPNLLVQFLNCASNQYIGIVNILQQDNISREVPLVHRDALELDIQAASASGRFFVARDLLMQVQILNAVRRAVEGTASTGNLIPCLQQRGSKGLDLLLMALVSVLPTADKLSLERLHFFILDLVEAGVPRLAAKVVSSAALEPLLTAEQREHLKKKADPSVPSLAPSWSHEPPEINKPHLQRGLLEEALIQSFDPNEIRDLISQLNTLFPGRVPCRINTKWELPTPLNSVILGMPRGSFQDITYILLAKAKELTLAENFEGARRLLAAVNEEVQQTSAQLMPALTYKLTRLVSWEVLLGNIVQFLAEWPTQLPETEPSPSLGQGRVELAAQCRSCLGNLGENIIPRSEVLEHCALALLNLGEWDFIAGLDKRWSIYFELHIAIAHACQDIAKYKGAKKVSRRDAWELILPVFGSSQAKRTSTTNTSGHRDSPGTGSVQGRAQLQTFLSRLREPTAIAVAVSLLARLYNVLKDEPSLELNVEYVALWPAVVSNANSFSSRSVGEVLSQLLQQALKYYPGNVSWLKVLGDISFANGYYSSALKSYLESCIAVSGYFNQPMPRGEIDDQVYRRMIKCCTQLQCHTQAAVLCQFLDEVDYATAFKSLQEKSSADAMDAYYSCIWDTTLLEFLLHLHAKRGEQDRRQQANRILGLLELNSNNNEEIRREAANVRKARFLRAMARHYVC